VIFSTILLQKISQAVVVRDGIIEGWRQEPTLFLGHGSDNRCRIGPQRNVPCKVMSSTPKMHMKKTKGLFALVEGECDWVVFTGRNYKGSSQHLSQLQKVRLGVVRSARLLCSASSSHRSASRFSTAGSSGRSLLTGFAMTGIVLMVALLAIVWKKRKSSWSGGEAGAEPQEQELQEMVEGREEKLLVGRIEPAGGVEQGRVTTSFTGRDSEGRELKKVAEEDTGLI